MTIAKERLTWMISFVAINIVFITFSVWLRNNLWTLTFSKSDSNSITKFVTTNLINAQFSFT